ncbi:MAG: dihydrofolate reductase family protein [Microthrixaceae bacterium]
MRQLLPTTQGHVDPRDLMERTSRPTGRGRPWVMANMVMSADGAYASSGTSRGISSDADREVFHLLRAASDVIVVGAGTARTERYRRPSTRPELAGLRSELELEPAPRLAVVTRTASFPADQPFLRGDGPEPIVFHPRDLVQADAPGGIELRPVGSSEVDLGEMMKSLYADGARVVLCEGGPHLLGQLVAGELLDELFLTLSPTLVGGSQIGLLGGMSQLDQQMRLIRLIEADGHLMLTYRTAHSSEL